MQDRTKLLSLITITGTEINDFG